MTEDEAIKRLGEIYGSHNYGDDEAIHSLEDELLVDIVRSLGWSRLMEMYDGAKHCRWCA